MSDRKTSAAFTAWKYNEAKTLQTLCRRVASIAKHLRQRRVQVTDRAVASNYVKVNEEEVPDSASLLHFTEFRSPSTLCFTLLSRVELGFFGVQPSFAVFGFIFL